ncbi:hypothetical protein Tco_1458767 [Tanacetum coccineum]
MRIYDKGVAHANSVAITIEDNQQFEVVTRTGVIRTLFSTSTVRSGTNIQARQFKELIETELADKQSNGLCFKCNEKFTIGHQCPSKTLQVLLVMDEEDEDDDLEGMGNVSVFGGFEERVGIFEEELRLCLEDEERMRLEQEMIIEEEKSFRLEEAKRMRLEEEKMLPIGELLLQNSMPLFYANGDKYAIPWNDVDQACSFMLCDLDFEPLSLSLSSMPSCDLMSLTNMLILLHYLESFKSEFAEVFVFKS